jgi:signal transduction histidine kinase
VRYAAGVVAIAAACFAFAEGGKALLLTGPAGAFWPAGGLAIAILYIGGLRWWPGVLLGDIGSLLHDVLSTDLGLPPGVAVAEAAGDMGRALVAVALLTRLAGPRARLDRLQEVGGVLVAVAAGAVISATTALLALRAAGELTTSEMALFWRSWWLGDLSGGLVVVPFAMAWMPPFPLSLRGRTAWKGALMVAAVVLLSAIGLSAEQPLMYIVFPALIWAAIRFGPRGAALAVAVAVLMAVWATSNDLGPFVEQAPTDSALNLQLYITIAALTTFCLAAVVAERSRASSELAESRTRIATAGAQERLRMEHDLHDSAQNRLVGLQIRLRMAQDRLEPTAPQLASDFAEFIEEAEEIGEELRRIAHGLSPRLLATRGLVEALSAEGEHSAIPVDVAADVIGSSTPEVESAVFLCCLESLQNAAKHAGPDASVRIRLQREGDALAFSIHDTGRGFDPRRTPEGAGLTNLRDRIETVGGRVAVAAAPSRGTTVMGVVPWPPRGG